MTKMYMCCRSEHKIMPKIEYLRNTSKVVFEQLKEQ